MLALINQVIGISCYAHGNDLFIQVRNFSGNLIDTFDPGIQGEVQFSVHLIKIRRNISKCLAEEFAPFKEHVSFRISRGIIGKIIPRVPKIRHLSGQASPGVFIENTLQDLHIEFLFRSS